MSSTIHIAVLFGGPSAEYPVSCASAAAVLSHLDPERFAVTPIRITPQGRWVVGKHDPGLADAGALDAAALQHLTRDELLPPDCGVLESAAAGVTALSDCDVAFPVFHGPYGEDGTIQALFEVIGVPYVGNGPLAGAAGMDKEYTKKLLAAEGLTVADGVVLREDDTTVDAATRDRLGLPVFVKPARDGSSIGVSKVDDWDALTAALALARASDRKVLVEAAVPGREVDIGVLELPNGALVTGPPLEIRLTGPAAGGGFFDHRAKYSPDHRAQFQVPADLPEAVAVRLREQALTAFRALGCNGLLRVDFFLRPDGDDLVPVVNEVNTFPGFTALSQYPLIWQAAGMSFQILLSTLVDTALRTERPGVRPVS